MGSAPSEELVDYLSRSPEDTFQKCWFGRDELIENPSTIAPVTASAVMTDPEAPPPTNFVLQSASAPKEGMVSNEPSAASLPPPPVLPSGPREFDHSEGSRRERIEEVSRLLRSGEISLCLCIDGRPVTQIPDATRLAGVGYVPLIYPTQDTTPHSVPVVSVQGHEHYLVPKESLKSLISQALAEHQTGNVPIASLPEHAFVRVGAPIRPLKIIEFPKASNHPATSAHLQAPTGVEDRIAGMYDFSPSATTGYGVNHSPQFEDRFVSIGGFSGNASGHEYIGVQQGMQAQLEGGMQANSYYNMVGQGQHGTYPHMRSHPGAYANLYHAGEPGQAPTTQQLLPLPLNFMY